MAPPPRTVALVRTGRFPEPLRQRLGETSDHVAKVIERPGVRCVVYDATQGQLPSADEFDGVVVCGNFDAAFSLDADPEDLPDWIPPLGEKVREWAESGKPMFPICFGLQVLGWAYGAEVKENERGMEKGTQKIRKTDEGRVDPIFDGIPDEFEASQFHTDSVFKPENIPGAKVLAFNEHSPVQALAIGPNVRAVQFHPELGPEELRPLVGLKTDAAKVPLNDTSAARKMLDNFVVNFVDTERDE